MGLWLLGRAFRSHEVCKSFLLDLFLLGVDGDRIFRLDGRRTVYEKLTAQLSAVSVEGFQVIDYHSNQADLLHIQEFAYADTRAEEVIVPVHVAQEHQLLHIAVVAQDHDIRHVVDDREEVAYGVTRH